MGYSPQGHKESDMTERLSMHMCINFQIYAIGHNRPPTAALPALCLGITTLCM